MALQGEIRNGGFYDPIRYRDWGYCKVARNSSEDPPDHAKGGGVDKEYKSLLPSHGGSIDGIELSRGPSRQVPREIARSLMENKTEAHHDADDEDDDNITARLTGPRYLCFINDCSDESTPSCTLWKVNDYIKKYGHDVSTEYIFVSYTRKQFDSPTPQELDNYTGSDIAQKRNMADHYKQILLNHGARAARAAGVPAFWIDFNCVQQDDPLLSTNDDIEDVWRICDVVRAAHSMVIITGPTLLNRMQTPDDRSNGLWLREWATRLWTLPEILLCSSENRITVYAVGDSAPPRKLAKRNFAALSCQDAGAVQQLVDHYESSVHLTPLELISIALECLQRRQTEQRNAGDVSYALQGLLRRRPKVDKTDSSFEAFARLSLSNDSDMLLERLLCMLPARRDAPWHDFHDAWGARLWDIEPSCQIAGIVDNETITVDGAFAASINWETLECVAFLKRETLLRSAAKFVLRGVPLWFFTSLALVVNSIAVDPNRRWLGGRLLPLDILGLCMLFVSCVTILCAPAMIIDLYRGTFRSQQAWFFGIEGKVSDLGLIEKYLFGTNYNRIKWSSNGSLQSQHRFEDGECVAFPPSTDYPHHNGKGTGDCSQHAETFFTLIDTYAMTATAFYSARPPTAVIVCGREGGMQRAVLCSYDWRTQTFCRETVLRMKTIILERMTRIDRFRFALSRPNR